MNRTAPPGALTTGHYAGFNPSTSSANRDNGDTADPTLIMGYGH